jgi:hypothetical protein
MTEDFINHKTIVIWTIPAVADVKAWPPHVVSKNTRNFRVSRMTKGRFSVRVYFVPVRTAPHFRKVS